MRTLLAVLRRETWERRQIAWLGLFLGVLCPAFAYLSARSRPAEDVYVSMAFGVSISFFLFMSLLVGLGLFASDQASGRMGFYLSRPVRPWQLIVGRVVAAIVALLVSATLVLAPTLALVGKLWRPLDSNPIVLALWLVGLILAAAHVAAVALRLRGRWTLFDLAALTATGLLAGSIIQSSKRLGGGGFGAQILVVMLAGIVVLAAILGVWAQLRFGGVQRGRLHAAFSLTFWTLVLAVTAYHQAQMRQAATMDWDDVHSFAEVIPSNDGSAAWIAPRLSRPVSFILDLETGRHFTLEDVVWFPHTRFGQWSPWDPRLQGRTAAWLGCVSQETSRRSMREQENCSYRILDLDADEPQPLAIPGLDAPKSMGVALSPDGRHLAHLEAGRVRILSVASLRPIHEVDLPTARHLIGFREDGSLLVVLRSDSGSSLATVFPEGSVHSHSMEGTFWAWDSSPEFLIQGDSRARWLADLEGNKLREVPIDAFDALDRRLVGEWLAWTSSREVRFAAEAADGRRMEPLHLLPKLPPTHEGSGQSRSRIGPDLGGDRVLVSMGSVRHGRPLKIWGPLGLARLATLDFSRFFQEPSALKQLSAEGRALEDFWTTYYVDLDAGTLVATFDGFRVLPKRIETPSGPEAWLVDDERGMPYRFHPKRLDPQNPISSLEPVFRPPWDDE